MNMSRLNQIVCGMLATGQKNVQAEGATINITPVRLTEIKISMY